MNANNRILIYSDTHLGAIGFKKDAFNNFLDKLLDGTLGTKIQYLIMLGDFLDVCMESPEFLCKDYEDIYSKLEHIKDKYNLEIITILGNHEIPVTGNYEEYSYDFEQGKKDFYGEFQDCKKILRLLEEKKTCEYILLSFKNGFEFQTFDSVEQISSQIPPNKDKYHLLLHGHQFDIKWYLALVAPNWKRMLAYPRWLKILCDVVWNGILRARLFSDDKRQIITTNEVNVIKNCIKKESHSKIFTIRKTLTKIEKKEAKSDKKDKKFLKKGDHQGYLKQKELHLNKMKEVLNALSLDDFILKDETDQAQFEEMIKNVLEVYFWDSIHSRIIEELKIKRIEEFLKFNDLIKLDEVIYGHTHKEANFNLESLKTHVINDGAWQLRRSQEPSYCIINNKGEVSLKNFMS